MPADFHTFLSTLIDEAAEEKTVNFYETAAEIMLGQPPTITYIGTGSYQVQMIKETLAPVLLAKECGATTRRYGNASNHVRIVDILNIAVKFKKVLMIEFREWPTQKRPVSIFVFAVGKRHVELVKEYLTPILASEEIGFQQQLITGNEELPPETIAALKGE